MCNGPGVQPLLWGMSDARLRARICVQSPKMRMIRRGINPTARGGINLRDAASQLHRTVLIRDYVWHDQLAVLGVTVSALQPWHRVGAFFFFRGLFAYGPTMTELAEAPTAT